jgi:hypothetical protein
LESYSGAVFGVAKESVHFWGHMTQNLNFLGQTVTVSECEDRSVTLSKWGSGKTTDQGTKCVRSYVHSDQV